MIEFDVVGALWGVEELREGRRVAAKRGAGKGMKISGIRAGGGGEREWGGRKSSCS